MHGLALNLEMDLEPFSWFSPCGLSGGGVTHLAGWVERAPSPSKAWEKVSTSVLRKLIDMPEYDG